MEKPFSFYNGYTFSFDVEGNNIQAWFSTLSGLEKIYVNGDLVASQRSFKRKTSNSFSLSGIQYTTVFENKGIFKGTFFFSFFWEASFLHFTLSEHPCIAVPGNMTVVIGMPIRLAHNRPGV